MRRGAWVAFLCIPLLACSGDSGGDDPASSVDRWQLEPIARIGSVTDAEVGFTRVDQVVIGSDEALYVPQSSDGSIRIYRPSGERVARFGQTGEGPEEFGSLHGVGFVNDTLYVLDGARSRVVFLTPAGEILGDRAWSPALFRAGRAVIVPGGPQRFVLAPDHTALVRPGMAVPAQPRGSSSSGPTAEIRVPILAVAPDSEIRDTILWLPGGQTGTTVEQGGQRFGIRSPFARGPLATILPDGAGVVVVEWGPEPNPADATFSVTLLGGARDTLFARSFPYEPREMSGERLAWTLERAEVSSPGDPEALDGSAVAHALREAGLIPETQAPVSAVVGGEDGTVWIAREPGADSTAWEMLDGTGERLGRIVLPGREEVIASREDLLVTLELDELDVPFLTTYRIRR